MEKRNIDIRWSCSAKCEKCGAALNLIEPNAEIHTCEECGDVFSIVPNYIEKGTEQSVEELELKAYDKCMSISYLKTDLFYATNFTVDGKNFTDLSFEPDFKKAKIDMLNTFLNNAK